MEAIKFGETRYGYFSLQPVWGKHERSNGNYWDDGWLTCRCEMQAGMFSGEATRDVHYQEMNNFYEQLRLLYETLRGSAKLETYEGWLRLELTGDGKGHLLLKGVLSDGMLRNTTNALHVELEMDQMFLVAPLRELEVVLEAVKWG